MSFLDMDEWLIELAGRVDIVFSPIADIKTYPTDVDVALVEGAIANNEHLHMIRQIRQHTRVIVSFGDCAVTGNVTALRNPLGAAETILQQVYVTNVDAAARSRHEQPGQIPSETGIVPQLLDRVVPVHAVVPVEIYLPGCPPAASNIRTVLEQVLAGETPRLEGRAMMKFG